jgi:NifU-like protein involved in Fe-S cluster formation
MEYSAEVLRRFDSPQQGSELEGGLPGRAVTGEAEDRTLHVWVWFRLQITGGIVEAVRFRVFGCPHTIAAASAAAERLVGRPVEFLDRFDVRALQAALDVPVEKLGKLLRIEDALAACRGALAHEGAMKDE